MKPFFPFRYSATCARPSASRWLVGSSISKKLFRLRNKPASISFVRSPWLNVLNGRYSAPASTFRRFISRSISHSSASGQTEATQSIASASGSATSKGK